MEEEFQRGDGDPDNNIRRLELIGERMKNLDQTFESLYNSSLLLDKNIDSFLERRESVKEEFNRLQLIWVTFGSFERLNKSWGMTPFKKIDTKNMSENISKYQAFLSQEQSNDHPLVSLLSSKIQTQTQLFPIVESLANKSLRLSHWDEIIKLLDTQEILSEPDDLTINELIPLNILQIQSKVRLISQRATEE